MSGKNKQLIQLKKLFHQSKEKYGIPESFLSRAFGQKKTIKPLSESTIKQNKHHLSTYYDWVTDKFKKSESMVSHIDPLQLFFFRLVF